MTPQITYWTKSHPARGGRAEKKKDTAGEKLETKIPLRCYQHQSGKG